MFSAAIIKNNDTIHQRFFQQTPLELAGRPGPTNQNIFAKIAER